MEQEKEKREAQEREERRSNLFREISEQIVILQETAKKAADRVEGSKLCWEGTAADVCREMFQEGSREITGKLEKLYANLGENTKKQKGGFGREAGLQNLPGDILL